MLSMSTSTSTYVPSGLSTSTSTEIRYSSTTSTSTKYSGPNPDINPLIYILIFVYERSQSETLICNFISHCLVHTQNAPCILLTVDPGDNVFEHLYFGLYAWLGKQVVILDGI